MTSLNPFFAAGWFAAIIEAKIRPPTTGDLKAILRTDSIEGLLSIPLFHILFVAAMANVGSSLATICFFVFLTPLLGVDLSMIVQILMTGLSNLWQFLTNWI
jgi:pheromone shutdown protein TraB